MWLTLARDCVNTEEDDWIRPLNAFHRANDDERAAAQASLSSGLRTMKQAFPRRSTGGSGGELERGPTR
jgi:hypothetical protein